jgi:hypothetical protein
MPVTAMPIEAGVVRIEPEPAAEDFDRFAELADVRGPPAEPDDGVRARLALSRFEGGFRFGFHLRARRFGQRRTMERLAQEGGRFGTLRRLRSRRESHASSYSRLRRRLRRRRLTGTG